MSGKAAGAYLTISEVSDKLDVPAHVLRFWETKFTQLKPLKRGGGRRYYREADIILLSRIRNLLYKDGFTIKGAQKALKSPDAGLQADKAALASDAESSEMQSLQSPEPADMSYSQTDGSMTRNAASNSDNALSELRAVLNQASDRIDALLAKLSR